MAQTTTRRQVLAFRQQRHHLTRRLGQGRLADAVAACGIRNTPPGSAPAALLARVDGVTDPQVSAALTDKALVEVLGPRMVPTLVQPADVAVFTVGCISAADTSLAETIGEIITRELAADGIGTADAVTLVVDAARAELKAGPRTRGDLSAAMTARLPRSMSSWCERCGSRHIYENLFRIPGAVGLYCIEPRSGREVSYILVDHWLDVDVPGLGSAGARRAGAELIRRFLRCYGPATPADFADWTRTGAAAARQRFADVAADIGDAVGDSTTGSILREDAEDLRDAASSSGVRLLPPNDPYLLSRDRETLVPAAAQRKVVWPSVGQPGTLLLDGEITGTWRAQKKGATLRVQLTQFSPPVPKAAAPLVEAEAELLAGLRGCRAAEVTIG